MITSNGLLFRTDSILYVSVICVLSCRTGVDKIRPAGQIRPADALRPARAVPSSIFSTSICYNNVTFSQ